MHSHDARLESEATFHDEAFAGEVRAQAKKFYAVTRRSSDDYKRLLLNGVDGARVLEYGCGKGSSAFDLARHGAYVVGIDISRVGLEQAAERARDEGLSERLEFQLMDAENLAFSDRSFDLIAGSGILHHLDLDTSLSEVARVPKPGGRAIFHEPLGHNPAINWYRRRTPHMRTADEHPLLMRDLALARRSFDVRVNFYHLTSLALVPLRSTPLFRPLYAVTETLDRLIWALIPPLRPWAWSAVIEMKAKA